MSKLESMAQAVLDARTVHPGATLADIFDPDLMPQNLRRAIRRSIEWWTGSTGDLGSLPNVGVLSTALSNAGQLYPAVA